MVSKTIFTKNIEERLIWFGLAAILPLYVLGALYISAPIIAWLLLLIFFIRCYQSAANGPLFKITFAHAAWIFGMLLMLMALVIGHLQFDLSVTTLIKSSIGWAKGWALLAIFIIAGCLKIRYRLLIRAASQFSCYILFAIPIFVLAWLIGLPQTLYVSPVSIIGGPGPEFFAVSLYEIDPGSGLPRWRMFTPWAPALGFVANLLFIFVLEEKHHWRKRLGLMACLLMIAMSGSRLAIIAMLSIMMLQIVIKHLTISSLLLVLTVLCLGFSLFSELIYDQTNELINSIKQARADSTRVREALARIAIDRWWTEAPIWGHGIVERGPHLVEYMPIGSHHTWYGLLFVKGLVGFFALLLPMLISFVTILRTNLKHPLHRSALLSLTVLILYTLGENLEILAYFIWPAFLIIGMSHARKR